MARVITDDILQMPMLTAHIGLHAPGMTLALLMYDLIRVHKGKTFWLHVDTDCERSHPEDVGKLASLVSQMPV